MENSIELLLKVTKQYENGKISLQDYKTFLWEFANSITSIEKNEFRQFLQNIEAELDSLEFTTNTNNLFKESLLVTQKLKFKINN